MSTYEVPETLVEHRALWASHCQRRKGKAFIFRHLAADGGALAHHRLRNTHALPNRIDLPGVIKAGVLTGTAGGLVLEDIGSQSLKSFLSLVKKLSLKRPLDLAVGLDPILTGLHRQRVVHKKINPVHGVVKAANCGSSAAICAACLPPLCQDCGNPFYICNDAALALHQARDKSSLLESLDHCFTEQAFTAFQRELIAMWNGETHVQANAVVETLDGDPIDVTVNWFVSPHSARTYDRVVVSLVDIRERKRMERQLLEAHAVLEDRMAAAFSN